MLYCNRIDLNERIDVVKSNNSKESVIFQYLYFSIMGLNFKNLFVIFVMIRGCCVLIFVILLLSLLKILIIVVFFMTFANLKQFIY